MKSMVLNRKILLGAIPLFGTIAWFLLKVFQFQINQEQYGDGIVVLQLSRGWLEGRPFLFDNIYGDHALQHNYYFIPLIGIFTRLLGVYGLFVAYLLLLTVFLVKWWRGFHLFGINEWTGPWLAVVFFVFGPVAYYLLLDYFGWHCEQYFIPLLALLSLSLAIRQTGWAIFWLLLVCSVKESSPVLICCLLLFASITDLVIKNPSSGWRYYIFNRRNWLIVCSCFMAFMLSLWWLSYQNGTEPSRLGGALSRVQLSAQLIEFVSFCFGIGLLTFAVGLIPFIPLLRKCPGRRVVLGSLFGGYMILWAIYVVESLYYLPVMYPAISFPARLGGLWGFMLSAFVFLSYRVAQSGKVGGNQEVTWALACCLIQFILGPFLVAHQFVLDTKPSHLVANLSYMIESRLGSNPYPTGVPRQLHELAGKLPKGAEVVVPFTYLPYFEKVYPSPWNHDGRPYFTLDRPAAYVCQKELLSQGFYKDLPQKGYSIVSDDALFILIDSTKLANTSDARSR